MKMVCYSWKTALNSKLSNCTCVHIIGIVANVAVGVSLWFVPGQRITIYTGIPIICIIMLYYFQFARKRILAKQAATEAPKMVLNA